MNSIDNILPIASDIRQLIDNSRKMAAIAVNSEMTL